MNKKSTLKIKIYSTPTCHNCHLLKDFLDAREIEYSVIDVKLDTEARREMIEVSGQMGVPVMTVQDGQTMKVITGYNLEVLEDLFDQEI